MYHAGISTHAVNSQELNLLQQELLALKMNSQVAFMLMSIVPLCYVLLLIE